MLLIESSDAKTGTLLEQPTENYLYLPTCI